MAGILPLALFMNMVGGQNTMDKFLEVFTKETEEIIRGINELFDILSETSDTMAKLAAPMIGPDVPSLNISLHVCRILNEYKTSNMLILQSTILNQPTTAHYLGTDAIRQRYGEEVADVVKELRSLPPETTAEGLRQRLEEASKLSEVPRLILLAQVLYESKCLHRCVPLEWKAVHFAGRCTWLHRMAKALKGEEICKPMYDEIVKELGGTGIYIPGRGSLSVISSSEDDQTQVMEAYLEFVDSHQPVTPAPAPATPTGESESIASMFSYLTADDVGKLLSAAVFAAHAHRSQRRKGGEKVPYINHPLGVAWILYETGGVRDIDVLVAAILHDVVEDCGVTFQQLEAKFGPRVASLVCQVTDNKEDPKDKRKKDQVAHCGLIDEGAKLVKLGDKIFNTEDLSEANPFGWTNKRCAGTVVWTYNILLNLRGTNEALEERLLEAINKAADKYEYPWITQDGRDRLRSDLLEWYYAEMAREQALDDDRKRAQAKGDAKAAARTPEERLKALNKRVESDRHKYANTLRERDALLEEIAKAQGAVGSTSSDSSYELNRELSQSLKASRKKSAAAAAKKNPVQPFAFGNIPPEMMPSLQRKYGVQYLERGGTCGSIPYSLGNLTTPPPSGDDDDASIEEEQSPQC